MLANSHENLILLCPTHHAEIDAASGVKKYTAEKLRAMKQAHEGWVAGRLATGKPVQSNVSQFYYINIPRLATLAALSGHELDLSFGDRAPVLLERGIETTRFVVSCKHLLEHIQLRAITLEEHALASADVGLTATFQGRFRTKGMPTLESVRSGEWRSSGITEKDPHIYRNLAGGVRLVLGIDPKWIVSTTSGAHFTPSGGQSTFAGLAQSRISTTGVRRFSQHRCS